MYALSDHDCESLKGGDRPPTNPPPGGGGPMLPPPPGGGGRGGLTINVAPTTNVAGPIVNTAIATVIQQNVAATIAVINSRASNAQANANATRI
jgi:hypothetical protein